MLQYSNLRRRPGQPVDGSGKGEDEMAFSGAERSVNDLVFDEFSGRRIRMAVPSGGNHGITLFLARLWSVLVTIPVPP